MKCYLTILLAIVSFSLRAQKTTLPFDERGKYIYYEVVDSLIIPKQQLLNRAENFAKAGIEKNLKLVGLAGDSTVNGKGKFVISKTALIATRPSGEVLYNFVCEVKDNKYRFWLTDFEFIPYMRDRYGNFVPSTPIATALEKSPGKLNENMWDQYVLSATESAKTFASKFKGFMKSEAQPKPVEKSKETISTKKW